MLSVYWLTVDETVTLEVDTVSKTGYLCRSFKQSIGEVELAEDVDLTGGDAWRQIASELGVAIDRNGKVLATGVGTVSTRTEKYWKRYSSPKQTGNHPNYQWTAPVPKAFQIPKTYTLSTRSNVHIRNCYHPQEVSLTPRQS